MNPSPVSLGGPLLNLEMRTTARRRRYYALRAVYVLVLLFILWVNYAPWGDADGTISIQQVGIFSRGFLGSFAFAQLGAVLLLTPAVMAPPLARARECRTLDHLLATDLSNREIVLGTYFARLLQMASLLVAGLPVLALAMLLGGISPQMLGEVFLVTLATVGSLGALSLLLSIYAPHPRAALSNAYGAEIAFMLFPLLVASVVSLLSPGSVGRFELIAHTNPLYVMGETLAGSALPTAMPGSPLAQFTIFHALFGIVCLGWATLSIRRSQRHAAVVAIPRARWRRGWRWRPPVGNWPMTWKELFVEGSRGRLRLLGIILYWGVSIAIFCACYSAWSLQSPDDYAAFSSIISTAVASFAVLHVGAKAASAVSGERDRDTWISLLSTTAEARQVVAAKWLGCFKSWTQALPLWTMLQALAWLNDPSHLVRSLSSLAIWWVISAFAGGLGLLFSQYLRTTTQAVVWTVIILFALSGGSLLCCLPLGFLFRGDAAPELVLAPVIPFLIAFPHFAKADHVVLSFDGGLLYPFVIGAVCYALGVLALWQLNVFEFAEANDRHDRGFRVANRPQVPLAQPLPSVDLPGDSSRHPLADR